MALLRAVLELRDQAAEGVLEGRTGREFLRGLREISYGQERQRGLVQLYTILSAEATDPEHPVHEYFRGRFMRIAGAVTDALSEVESEGD